MTCTLQDTVPRSITCHLCGRTSWHPQDVAEQYCAACGIFHRELAQRIQLCTEAWLGAGTTTMVLPVLRRRRCCADAHARTCDACGTTGYTHGAFRVVRCLNCATYLPEELRRNLEAADAAL